MKRYAVCLLATALAAAGCRSSPKLASRERADAKATTHAVAPATYSPPARIASPSAAVVDVPIALPIPETFTEDPQAVSQATFASDELPPGLLVNPAEAAAVQSNPAPETIAAPLNSSNVPTLDDVVTSVYASFPALDAAARERQIAAGKQLATMGKFDSTLVGETITEPLGFYENYRYGLGVKRYNWGGSQTFAGYRLGRGDFEPWYLERETNKGGEFKAGIALPFFRDRDIDKRRAAAFKAQLDQTSAEPLVQLEVVDAVRGASIAYWDWFAAGQKAKIAREILQLAVGRQAGLEKRAQRGEIAGIDLVDNQRLIVSREAKLIEADRKHQQAAIKLSLFLRDAAGTPLVVSRDQEPADFPAVKLPDDSLEDFAIAQALNQRPELWLLRLESERARIEARQASNLMLPAIDGIVAASQDVGEPTSSLRDKSEFEIEAGARLEVPLERREARGKLQAAQGKLAQIAAKRRLVEQKIAIEVQSARAALIADYAALQQARRSVELAGQMEVAERTKFDRGDSDLLLVNIREQATADAESLAVDAAFNYFIAVAQLHAAVAAELSGARRLALTEPSLNADP